MKSVAKKHFDLHIVECREATTIYEHLEKDGYKADFGLRFVWIAAASALDHYLTELIIEICTDRFGNGIPQSDKLLGENVRFEHIIAMSGANPVDSVLAFREGLSRSIRFRSFQNADSIADGLAFVWSQRHKWQLIADEIGYDRVTAVEKLNNITQRRNLIAHNADFNQANQNRYHVELSDAIEVIDFTELLVEAIEKLVV